MVLVRAVRTYISSSRQARFEPFLAWATARMGNAIYTPRAKLIKIEFILFEVKRVAMVCFIIAKKNNSLTTKFMRYEQQQQQQQHGPTILAMLEQQLGGVMPSIPRPQNSQKQTQCFCSEAGCNGVFQH